MRNKEIADTIMKKLRLLKAAEFNRKMLFQIRPLLCEPLRYVKDTLGWWRDVTRATNCFINGGLAFPIS